MPSATVTSSVMVSLASDARTTAEQERGQGVGEQVGQTAHQRVVMLAAGRRQSAPTRVVGRRAQRPRPAPARAGRCRARPARPRAASSRASGSPAVPAARTSAAPAPRPPAGPGRPGRRPGGGCQWRPSTGCAVRAGPGRPGTQHGTFESYGLPVTGTDGFMNFERRRFLLSRCRTWRPAVAALPRVRGSRAAVAGGVCPPQTAGPTLPARLHLNYHHGRCPLVRSADADSQADRSRVE